MSEYASIDLQLVIVKQLMIWNMNFYMVIIKIKKET